MGKDLPINHILLTAAMLTPPASSRSRSDKFNMFIHMQRAPGLQKPRKSDVPTDRNDHTSYNLLRISDSGQAVSNVTKM